MSNNIFIEMQVESNLYFIFQRMKTCYISAKYFNFKFAKYSYFYFDNPAEVFDYF